MKESTRGAIIGAILLPGSISLWVCILYAAYLVIGNNWGPILVTLGILAVLGGILGGILGLSVICDDDV